LSFALLAAALANAVPPTFQHIIIVIQENRTPDNLFGGNPAFEQGVDIQRYPNAQPWCLGACFSPDHSHPSWEKMWNTGGVNWNNGAGACNIPVHNHCFDHGITYCNGVGVETQPFPACPQETYVSPTYDNGIVAPYFDIAQKYGFANYFFQTNQGPSFPAHQFLLTGTSAPSGTVGQNTNYQYFAADNASVGTSVGCNAPNTNRVPLVDQSGDDSTLPPVRPCFNHNSLPTLLGSGNWKYYATAGNGSPTSIWTAPNAIVPICLPRTFDNQCSGYDWVNSVVFSSKQILKDLGVDNNPCDLRKVSWVIPNGRWSDHPGLGDKETDSNDIEKGPAWVASIINALGTSTCTDNVNGQQVLYWNDTVIFVVWDDWGGFWDHVNPESAQLPVLLYMDPCSEWGCGYVYGFRVPFLVISAYTPAGYVSGDTRTPGGGEVAPYIHDFGSILAFIENNFFGQTQIGGINAQNNYKFADAFAPELRTTPPTIPLADFFCNAPCTVQTFRQISVAPGTWQTIDFINDTGPDTDPDNDAIDND
jgi:phospholipase C